MQKIYDSPARYLFLFRTYAYYYGEPTFCALFVASPLSVKVSLLHGNDAGVRQSDFYEDTCRKSYSFMKVHGWDSLNEENVYCSLAAEDGDLVVKDRNSHEVLKVKVDDLLASLKS